MPKRRQLRAYDLRQIDGVAELIGVDEAGRGALAGPVVAGAVLVTKTFLESHWAVSKSKRVNDSKQLSAETREDLWQEFEKLVAKGLIHVTHGLAEVWEIEQLNILGATKLAMRRALEQIYPPESFQVSREPDLFSTPEEVSAYVPSASAKILVDGVHLKNFPYPHTAIVKGDARSLCVAMASVVAKVARDRIMETLGKTYPQYGFDQNKGYGTAEHRDAILRDGRCPQHRDTFLRKLFAGRVDPNQVDFLGDFFE